MKSKVQKKYGVQYYLAALVALLTFIVYLPALRNGFIEWDDIRYIVENPDIRTFDAAFLRWAFLDFHISNWHPLTWMSHALDYALWGLNPLGHHLTSIILHAVNTALVVVLAQKLFETARERTPQNAAPSFLNDRTILVAAGVTGLLFGIHPVHVESVAWVAERKDLLCALFFLLSVLQYANAARRMGHGAERMRLTSSATLSALFFFLLALMSKPMAVSLPLVLLLLDWYPLGRIGSGKTLQTAIIQKLPFFALSLASSIVTLLAQRTGGAMASTDVVPLALRTLVATKSLVAYLGKMLLPTRLLPFHPYPKDVSITSFEYLSACVLVILITAACVVLVKKQRIWLAAWVYYVVTLLPVLGIVQVGAQAMADRYAYLPSLGPFLIAGSGVAWASAAIRERWGSGRHHFFSAVVLLVVVILSSVTVRQIKIWQDSIVFWTYEMDNAPEATIAYVNRGIAFMKLGQFDKAIRDYTEAISRKPSDYKAFYNRGVLFAELNLISQAIDDYSNVIALKPSYYDAYNNRGVLYEKLGQFDRAVADYSSAISLNPSNSRAYVNRGLAYDRAGLPERALADLDRAISLNPNDADAHYNRGLFFSKTGQVDRALADLDRAIALNPGDPDAYYNRGLVLQKKGQIDKANQDFLRWKEHSAKH
jgi:protein O-mannosyl-transferase